jgi:quercetin dioxygenase-like cupin family protein
VVHYVGRVDWDLVAKPQPSSATSSGLARAVMVGPEQGAVHTEVAIGSLQGGGWIARHFHSFEESLYVLGGELLLEIDRTIHRLVKGDFALIPIGVRHTLANARNEPVRWMSMNTPQRLAPDAGRKDTFFEKQPPDVAGLDNAAQRPVFGPTTRWVGHYDGTPPQAEALRLNEPARGRESAGMDTALIMYSGISVRMLIDRVFGAELLTMFTVDYEPGGSAQQHDHPFEEAYFFLDGQCEAELDGTVYTVRGGDVVFAGVGSVHGFYNTGTGRVRWIETQAPQPPGRHAYRWVPAWKRFEED